MDNEIKAFNVLSIPYNVQMYVFCPFAANYVGLKADISM